MMCLALDLLRGAMAAILDSAAEFRGLRGEALIVLPAVLGILWSAKEWIAVSKVELECSRTFRPTGFPGQGRRK